MNSEPEAGKDAEEKFVGADIDSLLVTAYRLAGQEPARNAQGTPPQECLTDEDRQALDGLPAQL